jgi:outer membrane usher protein
MHGSHNIYHNIYIGLIAVLVFTLLFVILPCPSEGSPEKLIVRITLNSEIKGDYLVHLDTGDDFLIKPEDLDAMGLKVPPGKIVVIEGQSYASLRTLSGITYTFDKRTLTLNIISAPSLLPKTVIELSPPSNLTVYYPRETSAFLNYGLNYYHHDITDTDAFSLANKLGARSGDFLFLTDSVYTKTQDDSRFVRLMSSITYERRGQMQWLVAGDTFASSGDLGSTVNMGGLSFSKVYRIDPYFIKQPMFGYSGVTSLPTEASVYLNGMLVKKANLSPGEFSLNNLNYYGGAQQVEVVLKDPFGNVQRIVQPFYFTNALLRKGLDEYSYNIGFLRQNFGIESNDYGDAVFSAFHSYGMSDSLTVGGRAEATRGVFNIGPQVSFLIPRAGVVVLFLAASRNENDDMGNAGSFIHTYQYRNVASHLLYKNYSRNYVTIQSAVLPARPKSEFGAGISYSIGRSALSLDYLSSRAYDGTGRDIVSGTYSATITNNLTGFATARRIDDQITGIAYEYFVGINWTLGKDTYASSLNRFTEGTRDNIVQVYKNIASGEGLSYRATYESQDSNALRSDSVNPYVQYNARYGIYSADYTYQQANGRDYNNYAISASGAAVYAGGAFGFTRPVNDSFSIVKIDGLKDVKVNVANTEMGRTDSSGTLIIPEIKSYNYNQVSLDPSDVPMDYQLSNLNVYISPSQWSGSCIVISAKQMQAFTGRILVPTNGGTEPLELRELTMRVKDRTMQFLTGKGGEFYFENTLSEDGKEQQSPFRGCRALSEKGGAPATIITPGTYTASFDHQGRSCTVELQIVKSDDVIVDLGDAISRCEGKPEPKAEAPAVPPAPAEKMEKAATPQAIADTIVISANFDKTGAPAAGRDLKAVAYVVRLLRDHPKLSVEIEGHGDRHGSGKATERIGLKRAETAKAFLVRSGVKRERIRKVESLGSKQMVCTEETVVCDRLNRRVVIKLVQDNVNAGHAPLADDRKAP